MDGPSGIPYWRHVRYDDDGKDLYECLACKRDWIAGERPGWIIDHRDPRPDDVIEYQKGYVPAWNFCPHCGVRWVGQMVSRRKAELEKAIDEYEYNKRRARNGTYQPEKKNPVWVIQYFEEKHSCWRDLAKLRDGSIYKDAYKELLSVRNTNGEKFGFGVRFPEGTKYRAVLQSALKH